MLFIIFTADEIIYLAELSKLGDFHFQTIEYNEAEDKIQSHLS